MAQKANSLSHTKWLCKYHIVFTPKYRRKIIYGQYKESIRDILRQLCAYKGVEILEGHLMPDHVHMMVSIPPKISVSQFMGYLKGKSALMIGGPTHELNLAAWYMHSYSGCVEEVGAKYDIAIVPQIHSTASFL